VRDDGTVERRRGATGDVDLTDEPVVPDLVPGPAPDPAGVGA
jgi:hypothetical protein